MRATVFLSCGQRQNTDEAAIADGVAERVRELGFDCYIATRVQSLRSLRENIFAELESADYFLFIDFAREELISRKGGPLARFFEPSAKRGSLFSHQELAVASFLHLPALVFQEKGVLPLDGMLGALQANAISFSDRGNLHRIITDKLREKLEHEPEWSLESRNSLSLMLPQPPSVDAVHAVTHVPFRHFHVAVRNNHVRKPALNCFVYLESAKDLTNQAPIPLETIEFKWAGCPVSVPNVRIGPRASRRFDGPKFVLMNPPQLAFNVITDSTDYLPPIRNPGRYELTFAVVSENFQTVRRTFRLEFGLTIDSIRFEES